MNVHGPVSDDPISSSKAFSTSVGATIANTAARMSLMPKEPSGPFDAEAAEPAASNTDPAMQPGDRELAELYRESQAKLAMLQTIHDQVLSSLSWRVTRPLRAANRRLPRLMQMLRVIAFWAWLALSLRFKKLGHEVIAALRRRRDRRHVERSGLFDVAFYQSQFSLPVPNPIGHYLRHGALEGRWPNPLFDTNWYFSRNPDVKAAGMAPLLHYMLTWRTEGRRPNEFFDPRWYAQNNPDIEQSGLDPLSHYITIGVARQADPAPEFDARYYREQLGDKAAVYPDPLAHFLHHGRQLGLPVRHEKKLVGKSVGDAELHCLKLRKLGDEVALFVTHSPDGKIKPHVGHYLEALAAEGVDVVLIVAADEQFDDDATALARRVAGLFVRENSGYDFAAWAHVMRLHREVCSGKVLYLLNDSLLGPTNPADFGALMQRIRSSQADIVGLTTNRERGWHLQSYFLAIKAGGLSSLHFHQFMIDVVSLDDKDEVINSYEITFAPKMQSCGLVAEALFEAPDHLNATIFHWRGLLDQGFPFLKVMTVRDEIPGSDKSGWRDALIERGYDIMLADKLMQRIQEGRAYPVKTPGEGRKPLVRSNQTVLEATPPRVAFVGPWNFDNGLGVAARGYVTALMQTPFQKNLLPIHRPFHIHKRTAPTIDITDFIGPPDVAILHLNPDAWGGLLTHAQLAAIEAAHARIGLFVWESRVVPDYFREKFAAFDRIWAPSQFCVDAFRASSPVPVDLVPHVVATPSLRPPQLQKAAMRRHLALADGERVILYIFDATSYLVRKNPVSLVRAFAKSGLGDRGWRLVLKTKHLSRENPEHADLLEQIAATGGVKLFDRSLTGPELDVLMEVADIYASSHCSEGFGLTVAEAMARGKAVVATDYGGVCDFLTPDCGFPVACTEWETETDYGAYRRGTIWARVDEEDMAAKLIMAADLDDDDRALLAEESRRRINDLLSPAAVARRLRESVTAAIAQTRLRP